MPDTIIIANPAGRGGRGKIIGDTVARTLSSRGVQADLVFTAGPGDAARLAARHLAGGAQRFVVCGGDGVVHEAVQALVHSPARLGVVPCGRGNDLAQVMGIPRDIDGAVDIILNGTERRIDLGKIGDRYFSTVACLGFDAEVAENVYAGRTPFTGGAAYVYSVMKTLITYQSPDIRLEGDFGCIEGPVFLVATGNTTTYGGGMKVVPFAVWDDGYLDICVVRAEPRRRILRHFHKIFAGTHDTLPFVEMVRSRSVRIEAPRPLRFFLDGEPAGETPATIEVAGQALTVLCASQNSEHTQ